MAAFLLFGLCVMKSPIRILIADDHTIFCDGLKSLLQKDPMFEVIGTAGDGPEAVRLSGELRPDVLILDMCLSGMEDFDVARRVSHGFPNVKILGLAVHTDSEHIERMLQDGVVGLLTKDCSEEELCTAIRTVVSGETYIRPGQAGRLSVRERQVLQLLAEGLSTKDSADRLDISVKTVDVHRRNIRRKLGISSIAELTKYAIRMGITHS